MRFLLPLLDLSMSPSMVFEAVSRKETRLFACGGWLDSVKAMALWGFSIRQDVLRLRTLRVTRNTGVVERAERHRSCGIARGFSTCCQFSSRVSESLALCLGPIAEGNPPREMTGRARGRGKGRSRGATASEARRPGEAQRPQGSEQQPQVGRGRGRASATAATPVVKQLSQPPPPALPQ